MKNKYYLKITGKYLLRMVTLLIAVSIISFLLVSMSPVDPVQQYVGAVPNVSMEQRAKIAEYWGLNDPPVERFFTWAKSVLHGDFGVSLIYRRPVLDIIEICHFPGAHGGGMAVFRDHRIYRGLCHGRVSRKRAG